LAGLLYRINQICDADAIVLLAVCVVMLMLRTGAVWHMHDEGAAVG